MESLILVLKIVAPVFLVLGFSQAYFFDLKRKYRDGTLRNFKLHVTIAILALVSFAFMVSPDGGTSGKVLAIVISALFIIAFKVKGR
ncbi:MAG: hypothetical protein CMJ76_01850 [Planctomycetaceae bacterium]|nr:hypothetical protein [Planctomycetaceae bacterium]|tara:strand:+ start:239 stop:499 length:261 start_codon:yes stop_codon:yes gene_type:complete